MPVSTSEHRVDGITDLNRRFLTYEGRGLSDLPAGRKKGNHSIIFDSDKPPTLGVAEIDQNDELQAPIGIRKGDRAVMFPRESRLLWTRLYIVKHDVSAADIGKVRKEYRETLKALSQDLSLGFSSSRGRAPAAGMGHVSACSSDDRKPCQEEATMKMSVPHSTAVSNFECKHMHALTTTSQRRNPKFFEGDQVVLLPAKESASRVPKPLTVQTAQSVEGGGWKYRLIYGHGGRFSSGHFFREDALDLR